MTENWFESVENRVQELEKGVFGDVDYKPDQPEVGFYFLY